MRLAVSAWHRLSHLFGRIGAGATLAGLPLAVALTAAVQGWCWPLVLSAGLVGVAMAATFAPWIPVLHRLPPPLGAPRANVTFTEIPDTHHSFGGRVLEVGIRPSTRLDDAVLNFQFPKDMHVQRINAQGAEMKGAVLPLTDSPSPISWLAFEEDIRAGAKLFYFLLYPRPEDYPVPVAMLVQSERLYGGETILRHTVDLP